MAADAHDVYGNQLGRSASATFTTAQFRVKDMYPPNGAVDVPVGQGVMINLNSAIDTGTVHSAVTLSPPAPGGVYLYYYAGYINLHPVSPLHSRTTYTVTLTTALHASDGTPLDKDFQSSFTTESFKVGHTSPYDFETNVSRTYPLYFSLNQEIDTGSVPSAFTISPAVSGSFKFSQSYGYSFVYRPDTTLQLRTRYTVTLSTAMRSKDGDNLGTPFVLSFTTGQ